VRDILSELIDRINTQTQHDQQLETQKWYRVYCAAGDFAIRATLPEQAAELAVQSYEELCAPHYNSTTNHNNGHLQQGFPLVSVHPHSEHKETLSELSPMQEVQLEQFRAETAPQALQTPPKATSQPSLFDK
jgi:hypothetical protein